MDDADHGAVRTRQVADPEIGIDAFNRTEELVAFARKCVVVDLDEEIAIFTAKNLLDNRLPSADSIIFATAKLRGAKPLIRDRHFEWPPGVIFIEKRGGGPLPVARPVPA